jgi:tetratricopeptide (TPR) repeat protein
MTPRLLMATLVIAAAAAAGCSADPEVAKREYLASGDRYLADGKLNEAIVQYRNAIQQDPRFGEARLKLAEAYEKTDQPVNALREYVRAADLMPDDVDLQIKAGRYLILARQFEDARNRALNALEKDPRNPGAQVLLGNALAGLNDFESAVTELEEAISIDPTVEAYASLGAARRAAGQTAEAEEAFQRAVEIAPDLPEAHLALANYLLSVNKAPEAEKALLDAARLDPDNELTNRGLAILYLATKRPAEAEPHLRKLAEGDISATQTARLALADYYVAMRRPNDALEVLEPLADHERAAAGAKVRMAAIEYARNQKQKAHTLVDEVLASDPTYPLGLLTKARFLSADGDLEAALAKSNAAISAEPRMLAAHYLKGTVLTGLRRVDEAIDAFSEVLRQNPRATAAQIQLSRLNRAAGRSGPSVELAEAAAKSVPNDPGVQVNLVRSLIADRQLARAETALAPLKKRFPDHPDVLGAEGTLAMVRRDAGAARVAYEQILTVDPDNLQALTALAAVDIAEKKGDAARQRIERRLARNPKDAGLLTVAARTYATLGETDKAEKALRQVIEVDPRRIEAFGMLGQLFLSQGRLDEARSEFDRIAEDDPSRVGAHTMVAIIDEARGKKSEARKRYERILQIEPKAAVAANNLAYLYAEEGGNLDIALQLAQTAKLSLPNQPEVNDTLGWVYYKRDLATLAIPPLKASVAADPSNPYYHYHLGLAYAKAGETAAARESLERVLELNPKFEEAEQVKAALASL